MNTQVPLHDLDAEASVLSAVFISPEALSEVAHWLRPTDFYADANKRIAEVIWELDQEGAAVDATTVARRLRDRKKLDAIGGTPYLAQILNATPAVAHIEQHARIVADLARVRTVQAMCTTIRAEGYGELGDVGEWLSGAEKRLLDALDRRQPVETQIVLADAVGEALDALRGGPVEMLGLPTGLDALDRRLGGLLDGCVYVVAGRPGKGKTAFALQAAISAAEALRGTDRAAFIASLEMPREQLLQRAFATQSAVPLNDIRHRAMSNRNWQLVADAAQYLSSLPMIIDDQPAQTPHGLRSAIRRGMRKLPGKPRCGLIVVDYLQLMSADPTSANVKREEQVSGFSRSLAALAKEHRCPVIALSQLNRAIEGRADKTPQLSDLRESGAIEQDAFGIMFVDEDAITVAKLRQGETGRVRVEFDGAITRFRESAEQDDDGQQFSQYDELDNRFDDGSDLNR